MNELTAKVISVEDSDHAAADVRMSDNQLQFSFSLPRGKDGKDGKDGAEGQDGNGFDYIFCLTETPNFNKLDPSTLDPDQNDLQNDLFVPED